jgi:O-antigen/teichoic acid export membrane protein
LHNPEHFEKFGKTVIWQTAVASLTIPAVVIPASTRLVPTLFGSEYASAESTLSIITCTFTPMAIGYILKYLLTAANKQNYYMLGLTVELVLNGIIALLLIPNLGAIGAAISMLISQTVFCLLGIFILYGRLRLSKQIPLFFWTAAILIGIASATWLIRQSSWWFLWAATIWISAMLLLIKLKIFDISKLREYSNLAIGQ